MVCLFSLPGGGFPPGIGGIQVYVAELCRALVARGEELTVIATQQPESAACDASLSYPVIPRSRRDLITTAQAMRATLLELAPRPELIVATKWVPRGRGGHAPRRRLRLHYVVMGYGREFVLTGGNVAKWVVQRAVLKGAAGGLAISHYTAGLMPRRGLPPDRVKVIYAGVNPEQFAGGAAGVPALKAELGLTNERVILTVSRLVARKGQEQVIRTLPQVQQQVGPVKCLIVGDGPRREELEQLAARTGMANSVIFAGAQSGDKLAAYYYLCNLFIMTSRDIPGQPVEGFGLVYLEANCCGKPVIGGLMVESPMPLKMESTDCWWIPRSRRISRARSPGCDRQLGPADGRARAAPGAGALHLGSCGRTLPGGAGGVGTAGRLVGGRAREMVKSPM